MIRAFQSRAIVQFQTVEFKEIDTESNFYIETVLIVCGIFQQFIFFSVYQNIENTFESNIWIVAIHLTANLI